LSSLRLAGQLDQLADAGGDLLAALMAEFDGAENLGFRDLLGSGFHHHDAVFGACHHDVQLRFAAFGIGRVSQILAVLHADADAGQHVVERKIGNGERSRRAADGQAVGVLFGIGRQHHTNDLRFVQETFGEQRAHGPVNQPAGKRLFLRHAPLALDETAGKLAGGVGVLAIVHGEREKSGSRFGLLGHTSGD